MERIGHRSQRAVWCGGKRSHMGNFNDPDERHRCPARPIAPAPPSPHPSPLFSAWKLGDHHLSANVHFVAAVCALVLDIGQRSREPDATISRYHIASEHI